MQEVCQENLKNPKEKILGTRLGTTKSFEKFI